MDFCNSIFHLYDLSLILAVFMEALFLLHFYSQSVFKPLIVAYNL